MKRRLLFAVYVTDEASAKKVEGVSKASLEEVPLVFQAMNIWKEAMAQHVAENAEADVKYPEMMEQFSLLMNSFKELPPKEAERVSKDVAQVLKGLRSGK